MSEKTYFFGWTNIKWFIREIVKMYSGEESYFSKKRVESNAAFMIAQWGMIKYFDHKFLTMDVYDITFWAATEFAICGYMIKEIQRDKKSAPNETA